MRLIDADKLLEILKEMHGIEHTRYDDGLDTAEAVIDIAETIEPEKHGHWILKGNGNADCSICGYRSTRVYDDDNADHYCRHCGAKMDGDTNEL